MEFRIFRQACFLAGFCMATATADAAFAQGTMVQRATATKRVVMIEPDIQLRELDVGGIPEPRADWTKTAQTLIDKELKAHFSRRGAELVNADKATPREIQLTKLHSVVGQAILTHLYDADAKLPNKRSALDWTLGPGTNEMRDHYGADYALFVFVRDSYSSPGRRAATRVLGILAGVQLESAMQTGFASLVDLRTGNIIWFNRVIRRSGDLRAEQQAQQTVDALIKDLPI